MIVNGILNILLDFLTGLFVLVPTIPAIDPSISAAGSWITDRAGEAAAIGQWIFGSTLWGALIAVIAFIWVFEPSYHGIMWVLRKIPILSIK